jgi:hypothetical protein
MAVAASTYAIAQGRSVSVARPGAADATGNLILVATTCITNGTYTPGMSSAFTFWYGYGSNRFSTYGHYIYNLIYAKLGSAAETATYVASLSSSADATKSVISAAAYRISNPASASVLASNLGQATYIQSVGTTKLYYQTISLTGSGSVLIDVAGMLALSDGNAASLLLRTGDTETIRHRRVETDAAAYWLSAGHGYREGQSGSLALDTQTVTGNLGAMSIAIEVLQSAGGGGAPATGATGRVIYCGV